MRCLCISDLHGSREQLDRLEAMLASADLVLIAGDFTDFGGGPEMLDMLDGLDHHLDTVAAVAGNCDRPAARAELEAAGISVDGKPKVFGAGEERIAVLGSGGGLLHTGLTPFERREQELSSAFERALGGLDALGQLRPALVALTHTPPWDTAADLRRTSHVGSRGLRHILDALSPALWVCGHIHEGRSAERVGETLLVNPGSLRDGFYATVNLDFRKGRPMAVAVLESLGGVC
jgi:hypothetical protein